MKKLSLGLLAFAICTATMAQIKTPAPSPKSTISQEVGLTTVTVDYSRPSAKGREIFGALVPFEKEWRTGANSATTIEFDTDVTLAGQDLKSGKYVLITVPGSKEWTIKIHALETPNVFSYFGKEALATGIVNSTKISETIETFTINVGNLTNSSATIDLSWESTKVSIPLAVPTAEILDKQIAEYDQNSEKQIANDYFRMSSYLLSEKKNLDQALVYASKAAAANPNAFWMKRNESLILAELGKYKEAIAAAEASKAAAEKAGNEQYVKYNEEAIAKWKKMK